MIRVLVADDEALARRRLVRLLADHPDVHLAGEATSGVEVLQAVATGAIDLVLLDVQMPGLSGVEALRLLPAHGPRVVLVTAHAEHALAAFDGGAVDYVLKPVTEERLATALARVRAWLGSRDAAPPPDRLAIDTARGVLLVDPHTVTHAVIDGASLVIHTDRGAVFTDLRLAELERRLPPGAFERVHRQALVNLARVTRLEPVDSGGYLAHLDTGATVVVARQAARRLRRRFRT